MFEKKEGHFANICPNKNNDKLLKENQKILDIQTKKVKIFSYKRGIKHELDQYLSYEEQSKSDNDEECEVWCCSYCVKNLIHIKALHFMKISIVKRTNVVIMKNQIKKVIF